MRNRTSVDEPRAAAPPDFSLVLGGPLYQLWRRSRLSGDTLELLHRRIVVLTVVAWAPLLLTMFSLEQLLGQALKVLF